MITRTAADILRAAGLPPPPSSLQHGCGRYYERCPRCSAQRSTAANRGAKVLGITIDDIGVKWGCNHCGWTGGGYFKSNSGGRDGGFAATYDYHDAAGRLRFQKVRNPAGREPRFWLRRPDGNGGWINNTEGVDASILYRLPEVIEAIALEREIAVVEGEKDADRMWSIGIPATCNAHGAAEPCQKPKWTRAHSEQLRGAKIIVFNDNDMAGYAHADATAKNSLGIAARVRRLDLALHWPDIPEGGDVSDWLDAGHIREELAALIAEAPEWTGSRPFAPKLVLTLADWAARDLPPPDFILGNWLTTTSRVLLTAPTGLGKTMLVMAMGMAMAAALGFLHWRGARKARVLFIDGEMSRRLLKERLAAETARLGLAPDTFFALSHEDIEGMQPLNTLPGQQFIDSVIRDLGGLDVIIFDNVMALIAGDQKDEEGWRQTLPWVKSLTHRNIGQLWVHHTGHDETRSYGTKTREWQMDTVLHLEAADRPDTDVSFQLNFRKARERTPATRADFADVRIALVNDQWEGDQASAHRKGEVRPLSRKFFEALRDATIGNDANKMFGCPAASLLDWQAECIKRGLMTKDKTNADRALFSKSRLDLITANWIACNATMAWLLP